MRSMTTENVESNLYPIVQAAVAERVDRIDGLYFQPIWIDWRGLDTLLESCEE